MARNVIIDIKAKTSQYERAVKRATNQTDDFQTKLGKIGKGAALGGIAAVAVGIAAIGTAAFKVGMDGVKAFAGFERSMSQIEGLVGIAHDSVMEFKDGIMELSVESARGPQELADAMFFITSAGLEGAEAMDALEVSAKAAAAGLGDTAVIADVVTSAVNAYGDNIDGAAEATDVLVAAVREGKAAAPELAGSLGSVIPIASQMGVSFDEVGASIAAMTRIGLNAAESSTALRSILNSLLAPTTDANRALAELGLSAAGLKQEIRDRGLFATLKHLTDAFDGQDEATTRVFGNVRALTGIMALMGESADATEEIFNSLADSTGALDTAFGVAAETAAFKMEQAKARIDAALIDVGAEIWPMLAEALDTLAPMLPDLIQSLGDVAIEMVNLGVNAVPFFVDGLYEAELAAVKFETGLLRAQQAAGTGVGGLLTDATRWLGMVATFGQATPPSVDWDQAKADQLVWLEVQQRTMKRMHEGQGEYATLGRAVAELSDANLLNADSLEMVQDQMGLTDAEIVNLVGDGRGLATQWGLTDAQVAALTASLEAQKQILRGELIASMADASGGNRELGSSARWAAEGAETEADALGGDVLESLSEFETALWEAELAQTSLSDAILAAADPAFKAVKAVSALKTAEEKLEKARTEKDKKTGKRLASDEDIAQAQWAVVEAALKAQGALDALGGITDMPLEGAVAAIREVLGYTDGQARDLLETLGILDGTSVAVEVDVNTRFTETGTPSFTSSDDALTRAGVLPFDDWAEREDFHLGGVVGGPLGKAQLAVVHGGEEVLTPSDRMVRPASSYTENTPSRSIVVNVIDSNHRDLQGDIATGLIRAGVTEQVDLIGAY